MISFNNSSFFDKKIFDFNNNSNFKKNYDLSKKKGDELSNEFTEGKNEILNSFTSAYQEKIRKHYNKINLKDKKKVVIGLGGSSSGAKALSFFKNDDIIYFDNLDLEYFSNFLKKNNLKDFIFFIISKSGDTFETLALLNLLINESKNISEFNIFKSLIVITEDKESILKNFSDKYEISIIEHNPNIGGRFSVLSETGMMPFFDMNIKIENGSEKYLKLLNSNFEDDQNPVKNVAILKTCIDQGNLGIVCNLLYNYRLKHFSYWFHQLHAESLGKGGSGLTPLTSICPKDHHSMMQLYLDGPKDKFFNIFSPPDQSYFKEFKKEGFFNIENYTPSGLLQKQFESVIEVFREKKIFHRIIHLKNHDDPLNLIELFSYFILETILLGKVLDINPYDQPAVQLIKEKIFKS